MLALLEVTSSFSLELSSFLDALFNCVVLPGLLGLKRREGEGDRERKRELVRERQEMISRVKKSRSISLITTNLPIPQAEFQLGYKPPRDHITK